MAQEDKRVRAFSPDQISGVSSTLEPKWVSAAREMLEELGKLDSEESVVGYFTGLDDKNKIFSAQTQQTALSNQLRKISGITKESEEKIHTGVRWLEGSEVETGYWILVSRNDKIKNLVNLQFKGSRLD